MSKEFNLQFYVFDQEHFAIPIETVEESDNLRLWKPLMDLVSEIVPCDIIAGAHPDWLKHGTIADKWNVVPQWEETPRIIVLLTEMEQLRSKETYQNLVKAHSKASCPLRWIKNDDNALEIAEMLKRNCPIIMIGTEEVMGLYTEDNAQEIAKRNYQYRLDLDPRLKFWDSGIWHRFVPLDGWLDDGADINFRKRFIHVFQQVTKWFADGLYSTFVALENIEFQTRIMLHSSIADVGHHGHEERVTPFKFHSESHMEQMSQKILDTVAPVNTGDKLWESVRWRLLLVDDQGGKPLSSYKKMENEKLVSICKINKETLIQQLLNQGFQSEIFEVVITPGTDGHIDSALEMLNQETYDVILLDYLLGEGNNERNGREYGYDFLHKLSPHFYKEKPKSGQILHKGPLDRFWIFPISSFPFAFADKLRQLGMDGYSDTWHLSGGGDPVCTPALFRYNFLNFIKQQISECYLHSEARRDFFDRFANIENSDIWKKLVLSSLDQIKLNREILENDALQKSRFAYDMWSFLVNHQAYNTLLDHVRNFVANIEGISYFRIDDALETIENLDFRQFLKQKSALFFKAEEAFKLAVANHPDGEETFNFDRRGLRWIPAEIQQLEAKGVKKIFLNNNELKSLPTELGEMRGLKSLDLSNNELALLPDFLTNLKALESLDLMRNRYLPADLTKKRHEGIAAIQALFDKDSPSYIPRPKKVVISYAPADHEGFASLKLRLEAMVLEELITCWDYTKILPGQVSDDEIFKHFSQADIILLMVSPNFLASKYINDVELKIAMARRAEDGCHVVPIIWRPCGWKDHSFIEKLSVLPRDKGAISAYAEHNEAWEEVNIGIRRLIKEG